MGRESNAFLLRQQQSAFKNCLLGKCSILLPFPADSVLFSCLPRRLSPQSCINFTVPNQCFFISKRVEEEEGVGLEGGGGCGGYLSNTSDKCVAEYTSPTEEYLDFNTLSGAVADIK